MKILEITGEPILHGGQENFILNLVKYIDRDKFSIDVLTPYFCNNDSFSIEIKKRGGNIFDLGLPFSPGKSRLILYKPVLKFLVDHKYDVVHIHSGSISVLAYISKAAKKTGVKRIIVHSHSSGIISLKHSVIHKVFGFLLSTYPTDYLAASLDAGKMKYPQSVVERKLIIIKNGIDLELYKFRSEKKRIYRTQFGIPDDSYVIGNVGRFSFEKNQKFLIDVFFEIHKQIDNCYLVFVGDGELLQDLQKYVKDIGIQKYVIFVGSVDNPNDYYNMMDIFALPSLYEGLSYVTLEAQANGLPCVVSSGVPNIAIINHNVNQIDLIKEKWVGCLSLPQKRIENNMDNIRNHGFDIKETVSIIEKIYEGNFTRK